MKSASTLWGTRKDSGSLIPLWRANGTQLILFTCNGGSNQKWTLP
jgi:hypothetical protein